MVIDFRISKTSESVRKDGEGFFLLLSSSFYNCEREELQTTHPSKPSSLVMAHLDAMGVLSALSGLLAWLYGLLR